MAGGSSSGAWSRHGVAVRRRRGIATSATVRSFSTFCVRRGWVGEPFAEALARRREPADQTKAIPYAQLDRLWCRDDVAVREKTVWRCCMRPRRGPRRCCH